MKIQLLASVAVLALVAFENAETVFANIKGNKEPARVNKSDFDEDQAKPEGERLYSRASDAKSEATTQIEAGTPAGMPTEFPENVIRTAAPSAPNMSGAPTDPGAATTPLEIDPVKNAAMPSNPSPNSRLVAKEKGKFFVVDERGEKIEGANGPDDKGYTTDKEAWNVILALPR
jgi:hypothetical protein